MSHKEGQRNISHEKAQKAQKGNEPERAGRVVTVAVDDRELAEAMRQEREELEKTWARPRGLWGWFTDTDHKAIAKRYIFTAFVFFLLGGIEAALMRIQLAFPENHFLNPDRYNQIFTVHGTTMMFLFAVPIMTAFGIYFVPLMIGARDVAFPRLNVYGYFVYLIGGLLLYAAFFLNTGPDAGWFAYVPLSGPAYSPGKRVDIWAQMITFTEISALVGAVIVIGTAFKMRAPGMSINRIPLFVWAQVVTAFMIIFAMPAVMLASSFLASDRLIDTHFFNPAEGGDAILYQHLFWFFGHPEVYIIFIPALGFISPIIVTFARRKIFGYVPLVLSLISTGFIGFGLWVHHMFATPIPQMGQSFFTAASMMIAIPSGVQIFCWIATLWGSRLDIKTPLLFVLGFFAIFVLGGLTGLMLASVPLDLQIHDTFFVVAHLHYVLIGGSVFPLFGAFYYWFPKWTGRMLSERAGHLNFWLMFVGFNLVFFPMHQLGLNGMPRRVYTYLPETGWGTLNLIASIGAFILAAGVLVFIVNAIWALRAGVVAGDNPWGADSLEWSVASPPPNYNFHNLPVVQGRYPIWEATADAPVLRGLSTKTRETLVTSVMDAQPELRFDIPGPSIWPFMVALATGVTFIAGIFTPWAFLVGAILAGITLTCWFFADPNYENKAARDTGEKSHKVAPRAELQPKEI
ncbi:MAG TPA: cytochrome c oxidase subunit I [Pyrinomonadaceae bacterium]|nr:cytochrome c oxidase subunit I [Pyrinomonadaceae bacterium]